MAININIPIEDAVTDGSLNPVTSNAVFDALADKANTADLATVATTGDYNDLDNLPTIPAAQVNADWNATSGVAEILNKPTIPSTSGFVPYTGATNDVDLGVHDLTATQGTFATSGNPDTLTVNHSSGSGKALTITKGGNGEGVYINKTSGSGNAATIVGDLEATNLKRTGGTSSQFLKANGSIDSTSYQPTLVSGTNIKTVNGNSLLGSGDLVISGGGGAIEVGTTAVTSGTVGRVFFQGTGDVVQQSASLFWDNTNSRLGVGTSAPVYGLDVVGIGVAGTIKSQSGLISPNLQAIGSSLVLRGQATHGVEFYSNNIYRANLTSAGSFVLLNSMQVGANANPTARLDVRAQGALSTDIAFRVRNSADSANILTVQGDGDITLFRPTSIFSAPMKIFGPGGSTIAQFQHETFGSVALGLGATFDFQTFTNVVIGSGANTTGGSSAVAIGGNVRAGSTETISIGNTSKCVGAYGIKIGSHQGPSTFGGTNSIHLGRTTSGNNVAPDNVFMTYFDSQSSSTLTRSNGSFGLLGQQAYILGNGTGIYGTDTFMGNGGNTFVVRNHTSIPSTNIIDSFQQYSADITAGNAAPHFRTENGNIIKLYRQSSAGITTVADLVTVLTNLGLLA